MTRYVMCRSALLLTVFPGMGRAQEGTTYDRYIYPGQCVAATDRLNHLYWRDKRIDTLKFSPDTDTLPTTVRDAARRCGRKFVVGSIAERELLMLAKLYVVAGQESLARAAADRFIALAGRDSTVRAFRLQATVALFLSAAPLRMSVVRAYLAQLDSLGSVAAYERFQRYAQLAPYAEGFNDFATAAADYRSALSAAQQMAVDDQLLKLDDIERTYASLAEVVGLQKGSVAAKAVLDTAMRVVTAMVPNGRWRASTLRTVQQFFDAERVVDSMAGMPAPPVNGDFWYNTDGDSAALPRAGKVSVLAMMPSGFAGSYFPAYAVIRRLQEKYAVRGVHFVVMTFTAGSFRNHLMPQPAAEAEVLKGWFLDYVKLPATLAVEQTQFGSRQDGRRQNHLGSNYQNYALMRNASLVGKDGKIRFIQMLTPDRERLWDAALDAALRQ